MLTAALDSKVDIIGIVEQLISREGKDMFVAQRLDGAGAPGGGGRSRRVFIPPTLLDTMEILFCSFFAMLSSPMEFYEMTPSLCGRGCGPPRPAAFDSSSLM